MFIEWAMAVAERKMAQITVKPVTQDSPAATTNPPAAVSNERFPTATASPIRSMELGRLH